MKKKNLTLILRLVILHFKNLYAGTRLGFIWIITGPLLMLSLYSLTYSVVYKVVLPDYSVLEYIINVFAGIILLLSVMSAISNSCQLLKRDGRLRNLGLTIYDIPLKAALVEIVPFLISLVLLFILSAFNLRSLASLPYFLLYLIVFFLFVLGLIRILSVVGVLFKDFQFIIPYIGIALLLVTPISYLPSMIPDSYKVLFRVNPLYYLCTTLQTISVKGSLPLSDFAISTLIVSALYFVSIYFYRKSIPLIIDSINS